LKVILENIKWNEVCDHRINKSSNKNKEKLENMEGHGFSVFVVNIRNQTKKSLIK